MASNISSRLNRVLRVLKDDQITSVAYDSFRKYTPIRTGNARRNTKRSNNTIIADYAYARRLDEGYSDQAPDGMSEPTIEDIRKYVQRNLGVKP